MTIEYTAEAEIVMHAASSLTSFYRKVALSPELLLLSMVQDEGLRAKWPLARNLDEKLEARIFASDDRPDDDGWSPAAKRTLHAAWDRAEARRTAVTRGDLLSGLAGSGGLAAEFVAQASFPFTALDRPDPNDAEAPPGSVWLFDDPTTPMPFVVSTLREIFGCTEPRAVYLMYRTHFLKTAWLGPFQDAPARVRAATEAARAAAFPFRLELGPALAPPPPT